MSMEVDIKSAADINPALAALGNQNQSAIRASSDPIPHASEGGPSMNKRSRIEEANLEIENRLETLIVRLGDIQQGQSNINGQPPSLQQHMTQLQKNLEDLSILLERDLQDHKDFILRILVLCSYQLPQKCCVYTTLIGLLNIKNYNCGSDLIDLLIKELSELLVAEKYDEARWVIRFVCDLVNANVVSAPSIIMFLESLLDVVQEESTAYCRRDWYAFALLSALPWCGKELFDRAEARNHLEEILTVVEQYVESPGRKAQAKKCQEILAVWKHSEAQNEQSTVHVQEEQLTLLLHQIRSMRNNSWQERFLLRPYLMFKEKLEDALQHDIPPFEAPIHTASSRYPLPKVQMRMFDYHDIIDQEGPALPGPRTIERFIIEEQLEQILETYKKDRKTCAEKLLNLPGGSRVPIQTMVVEVLFGQLFRNPEVPNVTALYTCLFIELCKLQSAKMPAILSLACELIYERVDQMTIMSRTRFEDWFAHHLSNFQFLWGWENWVEPIRGCSQYSPKVCLIKEIFENCLRLSYYNKLVDLIPDELRQLLPNEPICKFKFKRQTKQEAPEMEDGADQVDRENFDPIDMDPELQKRREHAKVLVQEYLSQRKSADEIIDFLENHVDRVNEGPDGTNLENEQDCHWAAIDVFITTVLEFRKRSITHTTSALNNYMKVFLHLAKSDVSKNYMLWTVYESWKDHKQMITILIEKMLGCTVITPSSVVQWAFRQEMLDELSRFWLWNIVMKTIRKMNKHVNKISSEYEGMQKRMRDAEDALNLSGADGGDMAVLGHLVDANPPNEEELALKEKKLEHAKDMQKALYLQTMQLIVHIMLRQNEIFISYNNQGDTENSEQAELLLNIFAERLQQVLLMYHDNVIEHSQLLSRLVFDDVDDRVKGIFLRFQALTA